MPGKDGLDTLKDLKLKAPALPVLIFTVYPEQQYAIRVLKAGASGYINKECEPEELISAIRKVSTGKKYISPDVADILADTLDDNSNHMPHESLSDREFQVMILIASGKSVKDIADELNLSINTISTYRNRILEKMNLKNNSELTHYAVKNGLA
jgi:DNA-binding NarL/FixJ family response regulator